MAKRILVSLAFATWCFLNSWVELAQSPTPYLARYDPFATVAVPVLFLQGMLAAALCAAWEMARRMNLGRWAHLAFLVLSLLPLGIGSVAALRISPVNLVPLVRGRLFWPAAGVVLGAAATLAWWHAARWSRAVRSAFLLSWPGLAIILLRAAQVGLAYPAGQYADAPAEPRSRETPAVRVVWVVFDSMSRRVAFDDRPSSLTLPAFDRLRNESLYAPAAQAPGDSTMLCMPSLILGEKVTRAVPQGPRELLIETVTRPGLASIASHNNIFDRARALGMNTALAAWFHPYGRVLQRSLNETYWIAGWHSTGVEEPEAPHSLPALLRFRLAMQRDAIPFVGHFPGVFTGQTAREQRVRRIEQLTTVAERMASDAQLGLVLLHFQPPHAPPVYDRRRQTWDTSGPNSYLDSLALADRLLGRLREAIEAQGLWDRTAVLVTADHGWRPWLWRGGPEWTAEDESLPRDGTLDPPFLLKMPGQKTGSVYSGRFSTIAAAGIVHEILAGRVKDSAQLPEAISRAAAPGR